MKPLATYTYTVNVQSKQTGIFDAVKWLVRRLYKLTSRMKRADRLYGSDKKPSDLRLSAKNDYFPL